MWKKIGFDIRKSQGTLASCYHSLEKKIENADFLDTRIYAYFFLKFQGPEELKTIVKEKAEFLCKKFLTTEYENRITV